MTFAQSVFYRLRDRCDNAARTMEQHPDREVREQARQRWKAFQMAIDDVMSIATDCSEE